MNIKTKCEIIEEFIRDHAELPTENNHLLQFLEINDLGIPLAQSVCYGLTTLTPEGEEIIEDTWTDFCSLLSVNPNGEYDELSDMFN